jgi:diaminopimelate epimerase
MAAGFRLRKFDRKATITLPGGDLLIEIRESDGHIIMTGPVAYEFEGELPPHLAV